MDTIRQFYDSLAPSYDRMTRFDERLRKELKHFKALVKKYRITTALDAGAGTGFHSVLLSKAGVKVTAVDLSPSMLTLARKNARLNKVKIKTVRSDFLSIGKNIRMNFGAIFCLGNSLPHLSGRDLGRTIKVFFDKLEPGGALILQILNYDRILDYQEFLLNIRIAENRTTLRYYDKKKTHLIFNLLTIESGDGPKYPLMARKAVKHHPIRRKTLLGLVNKQGFVEVQTFGGIGGEVYDPINSTDLVLFARKPLIASNH